jgi:hypothetical protein
MLIRPVESWHCFDSECLAKPTLRVDYNLELREPLFVVLCILLVSLALALLLLAFLWRQDV